MKENKIVINMTVSPTFWEAWKKFSGEQGLSASSMFEFTGTAVMRSAETSALNYFGEVLELGKKMGVGKKKLK
jgi:hypothetical protein